jgi:hypothetical protein
MHELPEERVRLLKMTMPAMPIIPVDLFSRGTDITWDKFKHTTPEKYIHNYPEIIDLKVNAPSGLYDVAGLINWRNDDVTREISLSDKLGLERGVKYIVFDFWNQEILGVFKDTIRVRIGGHDTRVLHIREMLEIPQLSGISRHISGAHSILDQNWDNTTMTLRGKSETVNDENYSLFIHVPDGIAFTGAEARSEDGKKLKINTELEGNSLRISFKGLQEVISWMIEFHKNPIKSK